MPDRDWIQKRIQAVINFYGSDFFIGKKILDVGSGNGTVARAFVDMGAKVTCLDARKTALDAIHNSNPSIRCIKADLDQEWPFHNDYYDLTLHLSTLNHLTYVEKHLQFLCQITNYMVLDVQVCDSTSPAKYILVKENRTNVNHSFNGVGCRPAPAFIERILTNNGMEFEMLQDSSCNSGRYVYDWVGKNSNSIQQGLSRMWFAKRHSLRAIVEPETIIGPSRTPKQRIFPAPVLPPFQITEPNNNSTDGIFTGSISGVGNYPAPYSYSSSAVDTIKRDSRDFGLITPETFSPKETFNTIGNILPISSSSRLWVKKIEPFFPNITVHHLAHSMRGFKKSSTAPSVVMCSIDRIYQCNRIWIEEWLNYELTDSDIAILSSCGTIMTPSMLNAQAILNKIPNANVQNVERPWPSINVVAHPGDYYLYFEKNPQATKNLLNAWDAYFGKILIVDTKSKLPELASYLSDCLPYDTLFKYIIGAKAIIDLPENNYYMSGLLNTAKRIGVPVITNNSYEVDFGNHTLISQDKAFSKFPGPDNIRKAMNNFKNKIQTSRRTSDNAHVVSAVEKLIGM